MKRVVVIGPEASGKTTLAAALGSELGVLWTPEAARLYAERSATPLSAATVEPIARLAMQFEDDLMALKPTPELMVRDTDLLSTVVYARHYYGEVAPWIVQETKARLADLYLLCHPDLPWAADGIRDRPAQRAELLDAMRAVLEEHGAHYVEIRGAGPARLSAALSAVATLRRAG
jgi:nicotinamide riboside kinase